MDLNNLPGNSHTDKKPKPEEKKVTKVISGEAKVRKPSTSKKLKDAIIGEDAGNVGNYVFNDILIPSIKKAVVDIVTEGIAMLLGTDKKRRSDSGGSSSYLSYRSYSDRDDRASRRSAGYDFDEIIFPSRGEAEEVLDQMYELIDRYRNVSVADMFDLAGLSCNYTDNKYGWTSLRNAEVMRTRDGYIIKLPRATAL